MKELIIISLILILIKSIIDPKIDITKEKDVLLWYNWKKKRKFIIIN